MNIIHVFLDAYNWNFLVKCRGANGMVSCIEAKKQLLDVHSFQSCVRSKTLVVAPHFPTQHIA